STPVSVIAGVMLAVTVTTSPTVTGFAVNPMDEVVEVGGAERPIVKRPKRPAETLNNFLITLNAPLFHIFSVCARIHGRISFECMGTCPSIQVLKGFDRPSSPICMEVKLWPGCH